jgi:chemotaxis protein methyltransferase CheR
MPDPVNGPLSDEGLVMIEEWLTASFGLVFSGAKRLVLENRLHQRMQALGATGYFDYFLLLRSGRNPAETNLLIDAVTNGETYFFREEDQMTALLGLQQQSLDRDDLRVLSAGCSTGEEAYTLAILLGEGLAGMRHVVVDAIDIDTLRLAKAKTARYEERSMRMVTPEQRRRYLYRGEDSAYYVREPYRSNVTFKRANLIDPDSLRRARPYDAIFCRNVLIYFSEAALDAALASLSDWLSPGGLLFLGHSESIVGRTPAFRTERLGNCIAYRRTDIAICAPVTPFSAWAACG